MTENLKYLIIGAILLITFFIVIFFISIIIRRFYRSKKFKEIDRLKATYKQEIINADFLDETLIKKLEASPNSSKWHAIEDLLIDLIEDCENRKKIEYLFNKLGYVDFYEKLLLKRSVISKCIAINRLGEMRSKSSINKLLDMLKEKDPEIVSTTLVALSKIKNKEALTGILDNISQIIQSSLATRKTLEVILLNFNEEFLDIYRKYILKHAHNPEVLKILLEVVSFFSSKDLIDIAIEKTSHQDPEIRAKALKILGNNAKYLDYNVIERLRNLSQDPAWLVRLRFTNLLEKTDSVKALEILETLLFDTHWMVRSAAAKALSRFEDLSLDIVINALESSDIYAKESVCEALNKSLYVYKLITNLNSPDDNIKKKSKKILEIMKALNLCHLYEQSETKVSN